MKEPLKRGTGHERKLRNGRASATLPAGQLLSVRQRVQASQIERSLCISMGPAIAA